ncbi:hypothetical protein ElyMa_001415700 [Elysia marginata]|uniref:Uncharacterized protein n=1 Tax=Elysia marginata TaxID=1093978 RepID=A0AAV4IZZ5_9GAST|nr:hypothetical protein ElyMa_001415700 [Elysia marginata]
MQKVKTIINKKKLGKAGTTIIHITIKNTKSTACRAQTKLQYFRLKGGHNRLNSHMYMCKVFKIAESRCFQCEAENQDSQQIFQAFAHLNRDCSTIIMAQDDGRSSTASRPTCGWL